MKLGARRIAIIYLCISVLWITLSDSVLYLFRDQFKPSAYIVIESLKGLFFVFISVIILYKLIKSDDDRLIEGEKKYRAMYEGNPLPMWTYDLSNLQITSVNAAAIESYGYLEEQFLQKTILDLRPAEDIPKVQAAVGKLPSEGLKSSVWKHIKADGSAIYANVSSQQIIIDQKAHVMVIAKNITDKVIFEQQLEALNEHLQHEKLRMSDTQQLAKVAGWILYLADKSLEWSDELYRITDHTPTPGEDLFEVYLGHIYPEDRVMMTNALEQLVSNGQVFDVTHRIKIHTGKTLYIHHVARLEYADEKPYRVIGSMQDITEQKEKEQKIEQQNKVLQEIAWLNSHEIRGPVASILGLFSLYDQAPNNEEKDEIMAMINSCAKSLDEIVHNIAHRINDELQDINY